MNKEAIIILFLFVIFLNHGYSQQENDLCGERIHKISTNPNNPINEEWGNWYPNDIGSFVNTAFDWSPNIQGNQIYIPYNGLQWHPNFTGSTTDPNFIIMNNLFSKQNTQLGYLYLSLKQGEAYIPKNERDWKWEDGWELMYMNIGVLPNGTRIDEHTDPNNFWNIDKHYPTPGEVPYVVLYNRYTGLMRVFFSSWSDPSVSWDEVTVSLEFNEQSVKGNKISGILRHANGLDVPLTEKSSVKSLISPRQQVALDYTQWFAVEFQLGYDPCQCNFASTMFLRFKTTDVLKADLHTRTIELEKNISSLTAQDLHYFQSMIEYDASGNPVGYAVPGNIMYKNLQELSDNYKLALEEYKNKLEDHNDEFNKLKSFIVDVAMKGVVDGVIGVSVPPTSEMRDFILKYQLSLYDESILLPQDSSEATKWASQIESSAKKAVSDQMDFFSMAFDIVPEPIAPSMPVATFTEGRITGRIVNNNENHSTSLIVPGSIINKNELTSFNYPIYNQATGLFALLEEPKFKYYDGKESCAYLALPEKDSVDTYSRMERYFQVSGKMQYALNPALDFDLNKTRILGSIVIEVSYPMSDVPFNQYDWVDAIGTNFTVNHMFLDMDSRRIVTELISEYYDLETIQNILFKIDHVGRVRLSNKEYTDLDPMTCVLLNPTIRSVKFKIAADMYFNQIGSNGQQVNTFQVFTYDIFDDNLDESLVNSIDSAGGKVTSNPTWVNYYPGILELNTIVKPTDSFVWEVVGNDIYVRSEHINITKIVGPIEGYNLIVEAMRITQSPDAILLENTELISRWFYDSPKALPILTAAQMPKNYCGNAYNANVYANKRSISDAEKPRLDKQINLKVYPNPASNEVNVVIKNGDFESCIVDLISVSGQVVFSQNVGGALANAFAIDVNSIPSGYYIVKITTNTGDSFQNHVVVNR